MKVYLEYTPAQYEGDYPSITIHYRPQDRDKMERLKYLIENGILNDHASQESDPADELPLCKCEGPLISSKDYCTACGRDLRR